ncbi:Uncharacterised protein [Sphingobacterium thalpophilum]|uniref:Arm DNA-binding domain-containing protein n=2 Tax=Sphingobacterium thalpophilum TaxID=259 RepID=A0A4U9V1Z7_9SPHI|nr:Uncharacterised protein [Sphingobacterium thalpophilum]
MIRFSCKATFASSFIVFFQWRCRAFPDFRERVLFHLNDIVMSTNYSLLFYLKKPKNYVSGPKAIYMRITLDGIPKEVSTGRECDPSKWNSKANRAKGHHFNIKLLKGSI